MNYSQTLNLPSVDFYIYSESEIINHWRKNQINSQLRQKNRTSSNRYIIYGTPVPVDSLDWNSLQVQMSKDILLKYKNMTGADVNWITMWDLYNPSIERKALQKLKAEKKKYDTMRLRRHCRKNLEEDIEAQMKLLENLGVFFDWQSIKKTLNPRYEARVIGAFGELVGKRYLCKDIRPSYWCIKCQTILTDEDDMVNKKYQAYSGYVKFPVSIGLEEYGERVYLPVWVDTLWMLAASVAVVIREGGTYSILKSDNETLIIEKGKEELFNLNGMKLLNYISHSELAECKCAHPFLEYDLPVVSSKYVKDRVGIGLYNVAPGHNPLDYELALKHRFKTFSVVDAEGRLTNDADKFCGLEFIEAGKFIVFELEQRGYLMKMVSEGSEYPHCTSCDTPAIFRPVSQWLLDLENNNLRFHMLSELEELDWECNSAVKEKVIQKIENITNCYISCQKEWGMPIPIVNCTECGKAIISQEVTKSIKDAVYRRSPDSWFRLNPEELLPSDTKCPNCGAQEFVKEQGVLGQNFSSIMSVLTRIPAKSRSTNTTGIFWGNVRCCNQYLALFFLASFALKNSVPFDELHTYLFDLSSENELLLDILLDSVNLKRYSPDFLRLCVIALTERTGGLPFHDDNRAEIQKRIDSLKEEYELIVKRLYLIVGNTVDYGHDKETLDYSCLMNLDKIALVRLDQLIQNVIEAYDNFEFYTVWSRISRYIQVDLGFYLDAIKDRLYASAKSSVGRLSAQTVLWKIANSLAKLIAPIFPFLSEQIWLIFNRKHENNTESKEENLSNREEDTKCDDGFSSIFLTSLPDNSQEFKTPSELNDWTKLISLRKQIMDKVDLALDREIIDSKGQATVTMPKSIATEIEDYLKDLEIACSVAEIVTGDCDKYAITRINGRQCKRCSRYYKIDTQKTENSDYRGLCKRCAKIVKDIYNE